MDSKKKVSIFTPCYNEEGNVQKCYEEVKRLMAGLSDKYEYEHLFGDNRSRDRTLPILREIAAKDPRVKVLSYSRNYGAEKSSVTLLRHCTGDVCIGLVADLQEPPEMIPVFLQKWEEGNEIVCGIYSNNSDGWLMAKFRKFYYYLVDKLAQEELDRDYSGYGALDRKVVDIVAGVDDFDPYIRGIVSTIGFNKVYVPYERRAREHGESKHNLAFLFSFALNALISYSVLPIRLATYMGLFLAGSSIMASVIYGIVKLFNWNIQAPGATTTIVLILFFSGVQLFFLGVLGEYIGAIHGQVRRRPFVIVRERLNFGEQKPLPK